MEQRNGPPRQSDGLNVAELELRQALAELADFLHGAADGDLALEAMESAAHTVFSAGARMLRLAETARRWAA